MSKDNLLERCEALLVEEARKGKTSATLDLPDILQAVQELALRGYDVTVPSLLSAKQVNPYIEVSWGTKPGTLLYNIYTQDYLSEYALRVLWEEYDDKEYLLIGLKPTQYEQLVEYFRQRDALGSVFVIDGGSNYLFVYPDDTERWQR